MEEAFQLLPEEHAVLNNLTHFYARVGRHEDALKLYEQNLHLNPTQRESYIGLAQLLHNLKASRVARDVLVMGANVGFDVIGVQAIVQCVAVRSGQRMNALARPCAALVEGGSLVAGAAAVVVAIVVVALAPVLA
ncbi:hypothetical protein M427DRAFT_73408 [Gonapodya prolifera JEL478]|uniref:Uncharacterized protein n=1 Tax=Gonapodya prolifera (strain JEL478) TaxID=1344416 RepID=A0A139A2D4_GONPJ|nr:hypothetical protein M427DRAFT_73408 [Gonapodya prolifera JEL478]|eukprot:KXS10950.1 hypothetical protein M427DRAFT_73408 [Gonapodya prolifera JEL478]